MTYSLRPGAQARGEDGKTVVTILGVDEKPVDRNLWRLNMEINVPDGVVRCHVFVSEFVASRFRSVDATGPTELDVVWRAYRPYSVTFPGYIGQREKLIVCRLRAS